VICVICPLAESYVNGAACKAGAAAEVAATHKEEIDSRYLFQPIAVETLGVFNTSPNNLLKKIGLKISLNTGESRETSFLYQRISVLVQHFNAVLLHDSLPIVDCTDRNHNCFRQYNSQA